MRRSEGSCPSRETTFDEVVAEGKDRALVWMESGPALREIEAWAWEIAVRPFRQNPVRRFTPPAEELVPMGFPPSTD